MTRKNVQVPTVREFMATELVTLRPEMSIFDAINVLLQNRVSGASVVDEQGALVGVLSEKDCLRVFANGLMYELPGGVVKEYMSRELTAISPDAGLFVAADVFLKNHFRRLPVVEGGKLIGQVSRRDVLEAARKLWEEPPVEKPWSDSTFIPPAVQAALSAKSTHYE